jgi:hypothetical protein
MTMCGSYSRGRDRRRLSLVDVFAAVGSAA